jgi:hypothetical protein
LFPTASRQQVKDRLRTSGSYYAQEKVEALRTMHRLRRSRPGPPSQRRHERSGGHDARHDPLLDVSSPDPPLDSITRIDVTVRWNTSNGPDSVTATSYLDH